MKSSWLKLLFFLIAYIAISTLLYLYFDLDRKNRTNVYLAQQIEKLKSEFKATKNTFEKLSSFVYDELSQDEKFLQLLEAKKKDALYAYLAPYYRLLRRYDIYYLSILAPNAQPLLHMHKPQKKNIESRRRLFAAKKVSTDIVIEFKKPVYYQKKLIGYLTTAISYNVFKNELQKLFGGYYEYILKSSLINKSVFAYGNYLFIQSDIHPDYYYEENSIKTRTARSKSLIHAINLTIKDLLKERLDKNANFALVTKVDGKYYVVSFLAISYHNRHIGYLISYKQDDTVALFNTIFLQNILVSNILVLILLAFIYYFLHVRLKFEQMAVTDKLTGLFNRHKFYEVAEQEVDRAKRHGRPFSVIIFDVDHFKQINDTYGHDVGDYILAAISKLVQKHIRKYDYLFRWGGEEFLILSPETDHKGAFKLAEKIRKLIENYPFEKVGKVTVSVGISQFYPETDMNVDETIKRADNALYQSKREGRNRTNIAL